MKKLVCLVQVLVVALMFSSAAQADDDDWGRGGWGGPRCNRGWNHHRGWGGGYPRPQVNNYYYPQPQAYYAPPPPVNYYPPQPQYNRGYGYDGRSHQGLAGGVVGTVFGYELGNGDPLAAGLGAAAGSFLGNGAGWRY